MTVHCARAFGDASVGVSRQTKSLRFSFTQPYKSLIRGTQEAPDAIMKNRLLFLKLFVLVACLSSVQSASAHDFSADNNGSERGISKLKDKQRLSGIFRSDAGANAFFTLHSIADTAWKNNQSQFYAIANILSL